MPDATLTGLVSPVPIPFEDDGQVDLDRIPDSAAFTVGCGANGVIAAGTAVAQELPTLTVNERKQLIDATINSVEKVPVFAGASHPALPVALDLVKYASEAGADGLFVMPPWGIPPNEETILRYYKAIANETELPIFLYNNPTTSVALSKELMAEITDIDEVVYIKESSRNWRKLSWLLNEVHEDGSVHLFTTLHVLLSTLQMGGAGATLPPPATVVAQDVVVAHKAGDTNAAIKSQRKLARFPPEKERLNAATKAAMKLSGTNIGGVRPPYPNASESAQRHIEEWLTDVKIPEI